jgi:hypothetical protein
MSSAPNPVGNPEQPQPLWLKRLRKLLQLLKYFVISSVILTLMEIGYAYWLLSSRWNLFLTREEMSKYAELVRESPPLPENFMRVYTANIPYHVNTDMSTQVFVNYGSRFFFRHTELDEKPHCFCDFTYDLIRKSDRYLHDLEWDGRLQDLEFGFGIEKFTPPSECFAYVINYRINQLRYELSHRDYPFFFDKTISEFTDDEMVEFVLLIKSRGKITRYRDAKRFEREFAKYKAKLDQAIAIHQTKE